CFTLPGRAGSSLCAKANKGKDPNRLVRVFCGGDEGDRTPYLLNAIQALSQVSYTPTGLPSRDCFAIIANPAGNVNPLFRENLKVFFAAYSALSLKALNA